MSNDSLQSARDSTSSPTPVLPTPIMPTKGLAVSFRLLVPPLRGGIYIYIAYAHKWDKLIREVGVAVVVEW